ncbi:MAG: hypothetical protein QXU64_01990 [Thermofilaceae archaeon]
MVSEILTVKCETDGASTTGICDLHSELFHSPPKHLVIPIGMKAKIWARRVAGEAETLFLIELTKDITAPSPAWEIVDAVKLASKGELDLEKRRPVVLRGLTGREAFRISWSQPAAAKAYMMLEVEITDEAA